MAQSGMGEFWDNWIEETEKLEKDNNERLEKIKAEAKARNEALKEKIKDKNK